MKAAVMHAAKDVRVVELDMPTCGPKDVVVRTVRSGICGSDMTGFNLGGQYAGIDPDGEFGHETAGYITEVGSAVEGLTAGMKVFVNPTTASPQLHMKAMMLGGFSEYIRVQDAKIDYNIYQLPDEMTYDEASLIEPYAVATRGKNVAGAKPGDNVVVYGVGSIGLFCVSALCIQGIRPVAVVRNELKRPLLEKMGAIVCNIKETDLFEFLKETFGTTPHRIGYPAINVDVVVDCAGASNIVDDFLKMGKPGSRLSIVGVSIEPVPVPLTSIMSSEVIIQGSCAYDREDVQEAIANLASKKVPVSEIITHHYKLDQIQEAMEMAGDRTKSIKVIVDMED